MTDKEVLKKQIIYRSTHRGTKEMDLLLGNFVKKNIDSFSEKDLTDLKNLLFIDDEIIKKWYFNEDILSNIPETAVSKMLQKFKM